MDKCSLCEKDLPNERIHLGYTECLDCSEVDKYSSHTVYPHKTGGYIQPMSVEQSDNMKRLDRRGVGGTPKPTPLPIYIPIREAMMEVLDKYEDRGYQAAYSLTQSLYTSDKISLTDKSKITNELTELESMTVKQRKFLKRL